GRLHVHERVLDLAFRVDDEGGTNHALSDSTVVLLLAVGAVCLKNLVLRVAEERKGQRVSLRETSLFLGVVRRQAEEAEPGRFERRERIAEVTRFRGATGSHSRRVDKENNSLAAVVGQ